MNNDTLTKLKEIRSRCEKAKSQKQSWDAYEQDIEFLLEAISDLTARLETPAEIQIHTLNKMIENQGHELQECYYKIDRLQKEVDEQCRLNGMGSEREAALLATVEKQKKALEIALEELKAHSYSAYCDIGTIKTRAAIEEALNGK